MWIMVKRKQYCGRKMHVHNREFKITFPNFMTEKKNKTGLSKLIDSRYNIYIEASQ